MENCELNQPKTKEKGRTERDRNEKVTNNRLLQLFHKCVSIGFDAYAADGVINNNSSTLNESLNSSVRKFYHIVRIFRVGRQML